MKKLAILCVCVAQSVLAFQPNYYECRDKEQVSYIYSESSYRAMPRVTLGMGKLQAEFLGKQIATTLEEGGRLRVIAKGRQNTQEAGQQLTEIEIILENFELTVENLEQSFDTVARVKIGSAREKSKLVYLKCRAMRALY